MAASVKPIVFVTNTQKIVEVKPVVFVTTVPFSVNVTLTVDTARNIVATDTIEADTLREVTDGASSATIFADTVRNILQTNTIEADTAREVKSYTVITASTLRNVLNADKQQSVIGHNVLTLAPKTQVDSIVDFDLVVNFDFNGGINVSGEYQIPSSHRIYNEGGALACVDVSVDAEVYNLNQWIDMAVNFDGIKDFDGEDISSFVSVTPYMRTYIDGIGYGNWQKIISGAQYMGTYFDFKLALSTKDENTTVLVHNFAYTVRASS